jgi:hypothetical protein
MYPTFSQNAKEYFYIPHRKKERGIGGIFFDHYHTGNWEQDFALWKSARCRLLLNGSEIKINPFTGQSKHLSATLDYIPYPVISISRSRIYPLLPPKLS